MREINLVELKEINGGGKVSAAIISAVKGVLTIISDFGKDLGSGLRRLQTKNVCPCR